MCSRLATETRAAVAAWRRRSWLGLSWIINNVVRPPSDSVLPQPLVFVLVPLCHGCSSRPLPSPLPLSPARPVPHPRLGLQRHPRTRREHLPRSPPHRPPPLTPASPPQTLPDALPPDDARSLDLHLQLLRDTAASVSPPSSPADIERSLRQLALLWEDYYLPRFPGPFFRVRVADVRAVGGSWTTALSLYDEVSRLSLLLDPPPAHAMPSPGPRLPRPHGRSLLSPVRLHRPRPRPEGRRAPRSVRARPPLSRSPLIASSPQERQHEILPALEACSPACCPLFLAHASQCCPRHARRLAHLHHAATVSQLQLGPDHPARPALSSHFSSTSLASFFVPRSIPSSPSPPSPSQSVASCRPSSNSPKTAHQRIPMPSSRPCRTSKRYDPSCVLLPPPILFLRRSTPKCSRSKTPQNSSPPTISRPSTSSS